MEERILLMPKAEDLFLLPILKEMLLEVIAYYISWNGMRSNKNNANLTKIGSQTFLVTSLSLIVIRNFTFNNYRMENHIFS